jgi:hypothetical protein
VAATLVAGNQGFETGTKVPATLRVSI